MDVDSTRQWFVARIVSGLELSIESRVARLGFATYRPVFVLDGKPVAPVLPCYLFVQFSFDDLRWPLILDVNGVVRFLPMHCMLPTPVPDCVIADFMLRGQNGGFELSQPRQRLALKYAPGDQLTVTGGSMAGRVARFVRQQGEFVTLLLNLFQRPSQVVVPLEHVLSEDG